MSKPQKTIAHLLGSPARVFQTICVRLMAKAVNLLSPSLQDKGCVRV